jgi:hypothetical protein
MAGTLTTPSSSSSSSEYLTKWFGGGISETRVNYIHLQAQMAVEDKRQLSSYPLGSPERSVQDWTVRWMAAVYRRNGRGGMARSMIASGLYVPTEESKYPWAFPPITNTSKTKKTKKKTKTKTKAKSKSTGTTEEKKS